VLVESRVLSGDDGMLEVWRDLAERDECVVLAIGLVVHPGLEAALDVDCCGGRVDPPGGHKEQRGE